MAADNPPRWALLAALLLIVAATFRIASTWTVFNHTIDEPDTIAAGMEYLSTGRFLYEDVHPPLARVAAAIGPFLAGERFHPGAGSFQEGYRILGHDQHYDRILALSRAGILPFFWIACAVVFWWGFRTGGTSTALIALLLFSTLPPVLAHAGLATTDMALCAMTTAAATVGAGGRGIRLGFLAGLACVSKFSALAYLPAAWLLMSAGQHPRELWKRRRMLAVAAGVAALTIWAVYGFSFARVDFLHLRLPAPRFFSGIHSVWTHNRLGHASYLLGMRNANGFWYYFPVVLAVKTPLGLLGLLGLAPLLTKQWKPAAFSLAILLVAMTSHIDIGVRYVLPIYAGLAVVAASAATQARSKLAQSAVAALILWHLASSQLAHPDYLAYTNEIAGSHPERFLADSDLDWGQDMKRLGAFLEQQHVSSLTFAPFNRTYALAGHSMPPMSLGDTDAPSPGWNAVSVTMWKVFGYPAWADRTPPQRRIGRSVLLWYF